MKKLMIAALAAATVGGVYAADASKVYDYKASVKYVDFKTVNDSANGKVWVKVVKSATLNGYLVTPDDCCCTDPSIDGGIKPSILLVVNKAQKKYNGTTSIVKMLPANLLSSWWSMKNATSLKSATFEAQGYLFAGYGDWKDEQQNPDPTSSIPYNFGEDDTAATQYLFGQLNVIEDGKFVEPWLYASGFGKATYKDSTWNKDAKNPCLEPTSGGDVSVCLTSLSGSVIGGSWVCVPNGTLSTAQHASGYFEHFFCQGWNIDQGANVLYGAGATYDDNDTIMYDVITGTWSIKNNAKLAIGSQIANIINCGEKLDKAFDIDTFDDDDSEDPLIGAFKTKWIDGLYAE